MKQTVAVAVLITLAAGRASARDAKPEDTWPGFRGHEMSGIAATASVPDRWSTKENVKWAAPIAGHGWSSPIVWGDTVHDTGILTVLDAKTGRQVYKVRVGGGGQTFSASPIAMGKRVMLLTEEGLTFVLDTGAEYKEIAKNDLGAMSLASPAVAGDALYIRTETKLYKIGG